MLAILFALLGCAFALINPKYINNIQTVTPSCDNNNSNEIDCCLAIDADISMFSIDVDICSVVEIDWLNLDLTVKLEINEATIISYTFGLDTPAQVCVDFDGVHVCLELTDMKLNKWNLSGCLSVSLERDGKEQEFTIGCFDTSKL